MSGLDLSSLDFFENLKCINVWDNRTLPPERMLDKTLLQILHRLHRKSSRAFSCLTLKLCVLITNPECVIRVTKPPLQYRLVLRGCDSRGKKSWKELEPREPQRSNVGTAAIG